LISDLPENHISHYRLCSTQASTRDVIKIRGREKQKSNSILPGANEGQGQMLASVAAVSFSAEAGGTSRPRRIGEALLPVFL
jgi:hypothetical protein